MNSNDTDKNNIIAETPSKKGYKHTSLGWIPEDWEVKRLNSIAVILFSNVDKHIEKNEREVRLCNYLDVYKNSYIFSGIPFINGTVNEAEFKKFKLEKGDVVITKDSEDRNDIAVPSYVLEEILDLVCGYHLAIIRSQKSKLDGLYLSHSLNSHRVNYYFRKRANGITRFGLDTTTVKTSLVPLPSLPEQRRIAACLSTWDEAITKNQQLIEQLRQRNKGLMQQLLTGRLRLPLRLRSGSSSDSGKKFSRKWKEVRIKDFAMEVSIKNIDDKQLTVLSCTKYDGLVPSLEYFGRKIFADDLSTYKVVPKNHFAYATNHIEEGSIGYQGGYREALISPMYTVFKTESSINDFFFFKLLKSYQLIHEYNARMEGSIDRRGGLRWDAFSTIKIKLPSQEEQTAIATILEKATKEVKLYEQKLLALKEQKKGLMQVLMTGEKRLKIHG